MGWVWVPYARSTAGANTERCSLTLHFRVRTRPLALAPRRTLHSFERQTPPTMTPTTEVGAAEAPVMVVAVEVVVAVKQHTSPHSVSWGLDLC